LTHLIERYAQSGVSCLSIPMTSSRQREPYPSDLSDARWELMEPTLTAWRAERQKTSLNLGGKVTDPREVMNAILFLNRTGAPWRNLPHDFPPHTTVFSYFSAWTADGTIEKLGVRLRDIRSHLAGMYGVEVAPDLISKGDRRGRR
jgi:transposase